MALRVAVSLLASLLLVTARVSSQGGGEAPLEEVSLVGAPVTAPAPAPGPHLVVNAKTECPGVCSGRCSLHSRPNLCNRACVRCCLECKCVPPGTAGNQEMCGTCYSEWKTHGNRTKCP